MAERRYRVEQMNTSKRCIVQHCENHFDQGTFEGDLCYPCYEFISQGNGVYSQAYRNFVKFDKNQNEIKTCIVKNCLHRSDQGTFNGDLCSPCYLYIREGVGIKSQAYRNSWDNLMPTGYRMVALEDIPTADEPNKMTENI